MIKDFVVVMMKEKHALTMKNNQGMKELIVDEKMMKDKGMMGEECVESCTKVFADIGMNSDKTKSDYKEEIYKSHND